MTRLITLALLCATVFSYAQPFQSATPLSALTEPAISPDGREIAFVSGGDVWTVPSTGGEARLLISHENFEARPVYSPDGKLLAFTSSRTGNGDAYVLELSSGRITRLSFDDAYDEVTAFSPDSKWVYFWSSGKDISGMCDVFKVSINAGTPVPVLSEPYTNEFFTSVSRDGSMLAFTARGIASRQWWRNGYSHLDESEIWTSKAGTFTKVVDRKGKNLWPMLSPDSKMIYFISDRDGAENLWSVASTGGDPKKLTSFTNGRTLFPSISSDGSTIVFERDLTIWRYDIAAGKASQISITKRGAATPVATAFQKLNNQFNEFALSPDGKKIAFIVRGDVFAVSVKDGGDAFRVTSTPGPERDVVWSGDSKSVIYASTIADKRHLSMFTFDNRMRKQLTTGNFNHDNPSLSPDGKSLAYIRNGRELHVIDVGTSADRLVTKAIFYQGALFGSAITWSPDSKWIAFTSAGVKAFNNISIVSAQGGEAKPVSFLPNSFGGTLLWSKDGKYLLFRTGQRTENGQVARIDLVPRTPWFAEERFQNLFNENPETKPSADSKPAAASKTPAKPDAPKADPKAPKPVNIVWEGIQSRMSLLPIGLDVNDIALTGDGKTLLLLANVGGQNNFFTWSLDETSNEAPVAKQVTTTANQKNNPVISSDDKDVFYLEQGRIQKLTLESKSAKPLDITASIETNLISQRTEAFRQAWEIQRDNFYDTAFHGRNWLGAGNKYQPFVAGSATTDEMRRIMNLMIGELNASHSGVSAPQSAAVVASARIGIRFDAELYASKGQMKVQSVIQNGPADVTGAIKPGSFIYSVDDTLITASTSLDKLLLNKAGKRVAVRIAADASGNAAQTVYVRPIDMNDEKTLIYKEWVRKQKEYVHKASGGRLGYVHIFDMGQGSLNQLYIDLDAENHARDGVVVDVRNNNGGFVNAYALDVLARRGYMTMQARGLPAAPARSQLGQRSLESPTVLVINQHSLSDAEDFTEGYKTLGLGKVVGEPTAGWIIYTSNIPLLDGTQIRVPAIRITDHEGKTMELAPRQPDVLVTRSIGETAQGKDSQLDAAVAELMKELARK